MPAACTSNAAPITTRSAVNARMRGHPEHRSQQQSAADHEADERSGHQGDLREIDTRLQRNVRAEQRQQGNEGDRRQILE